MTLLDVLLLTAREAAGQLIVQVDADGAERNQTYRGLMEDSLRVAGGFQARGLPVGCPVILLPGGSAEFLPAFWGALMAGLVPVPLAPVTDKVQAVWTELGNPPVVVDDLLEPLVRRTLPADLVNVTALRTSPPTTAVHEPAPEDLAILQFSSGSTGAPKGVELTHANVVANIDQACTSGATTVSDVMVSWLPYFHDMGLIGAHLAPLAVGIKQVKLDPLDFAKRPALWFETAARHRATLLPAASFALAVTVNRVPPEQVAGLDLSSVRLLGVGAEPISVPVWRRFLDHMRPARLEPRAVVPLYGLAEATLAVTFPPLGELAEPLALDRTALARGRAVDALEHWDTGRDAAPDGAAAGDGRAEFMDVGFPVAGGELRIVGDTGDVLSDTWLGHVEFRGPNVARGYHQRPEDTAQSFAGGWLRTGDVGFLRNGRLCITGRAKDVLFIHGQKFHAHDLEQIVVETPGLPSGRVAVVGATDPDGGTERVAVFVSTRDCDVASLAGVLTAVGTRVRQALGYADVCLLPIPPDAFPRTTSGKIQRARLRELFVAGEFASLEADVSRACAAAPTGAAVRPQLSRHAVEALVVDVWSDVLGVPAHTIDRQDRFLAIGGSSLAAMQVLARLEESFETTLEPAVLRDCASPAELAEYLLGLPDAQARSRHAPVRRQESTDAAIIAMACRFPDASTPEAFWENLIDGRDSVTEIPPSRWVTPLGLRCQWGAFVDEVDGFDAKFFQVEDAEAALIDPHARVFLEVAHEALERAGYAGSGRTGLRIGVFVGVGDSGYAELLHRAIDQGAAVSSAALVGNLRNLIAARVAHFLDLSGPTMAVDTACSSSLVALHLARRSLNAGECDLAVVGGVSLNLTSTPYRLLDAAQALSATGRCRAFSADADGIVLGEGAAAVVMRPLARSQAAGDRVLAVVRGSAVNNDGRSLSLMAPNPLNQEAVIVDAYRDAGIDPATVSYVEAHGTGTSVGDPIEARSLMRSFPPPAGPEPRWLGSVKTNVGHLLNAAGMPSLVKVVLALQHRQLPASLHCGSASPAFDLASAGFEVVSRTRAWTADGPRRAGVNGFGFGGTNVHVILEEAPEASPSDQEARTSTGPHLLTLSAASEVALRAIVGDLGSYVRAHADVDEGDICFSASTARDDGPHRSAFVADGDLASTLESVALGRGSVGARARRRPRVVFIFTGQGSQLAGMGRTLHQSQPVYREVLEELSREVGLVQGRNLVEWALEPAVEPALLAQTSVAQPLLVAFEVSLARQLAVWGVTPDAVLGHSVGELAAAVVSGALSPTEAVRFAAERGTVMQTLCAPGAMAAVSGDPTAVERVVKAAAGELSLAAVNGPHHFVVSGAQRAVDAALAALEQSGCHVKRLEVSHAFHSDMMTAALDATRAAADLLTPGSHRIPLLSTVTGEWGPAIDSAYLAEHVRRTVMFGPCVQRLLDDGFDTFVEVGPGATLRDLVRSTAGAHASDPDVAVLSTLDRDVQDRSALLRTVGRLWVRGVSITRPSDSVVRRRIDVPTYPYQRRRHWLPDFGGPAAPGVAANPSVSPLLHRYAWDDSALPAGTVLKSLCVVAPSSGTHELADRLANRLARRGTTVHRRPPERLDDAPECSALLMFVGRSVDLDGANSLDEAARAATSALLAIAKHLGRRPAPLVVVTEDVAVTGAAVERPRPAQALAAGLAAALADEESQQGVRVVDLSSLDNLSDRLEALTREVDARPSPGLAEQVAWRHGRRLIKTPVWEEVLPRQRTGTLPPNGCYLVTGGAGGVGAEVARHLARRGAPEIILVGRSPTCPSELLHQLTEWGASPRYVPADVGLELDVDALVAGLPPLDGVFHAAGVVSPGRLRSASLPEVEEVLAPKVRGTYLLARALTVSERRPGTFVVFSSIASAMPGYAGGLGSYAAANAFVDAFAEAESQAGRLMQALNFAAWTDTGMATGSPFKALSAWKPVPELAVSQVLEALHDATSVPVSQLLVMERPSPVIAGPPQAAGSTSSPSAPVTDEPGPQSVATPLRDVIAGLVAGALGQELDQIDDDTSFLAMGLDSLTAVDLVKQLEQALSRELPTTLLFEHSSVGQLATHLSGPAAAEQHEAQASHAEPNPCRDEETADGCPFELSPVQVAFHASGRLHPGTAAYAAVRLVVTGPLDADLLASSLGFLERRHPMLRVRIRPGSSGVQQVTEASVRTERPDWFEVRDLDGPVDAVEDEICNRVFQLEAESPLRAVLLRESGDRASLLLVVHHAAADGASLNIVCEELWQVYTALSEGRSPTLPLLRSHFRDFVRRIQELRASDRFDADCDYWRARLAGRTEHAGRLPTAPPLQLEPLGTLSTRQFRADVAITRALQRRAAELDVSVFHLVLTAFVRQLSTCSGAKQVTVNVARAGRDARLPDITRLVGPFADTIPVPVTLLDGGDVAASARAVRAACLESERHASVSTLDLARMLPAAGSTPRTAGLASFSFARFPAELDPGCPVRITGTAARTASAATRLGLVCWEFEDVFHFSWNYSTSRFSRTDVAGFTDSFLAELSTVTGPASVQAPESVAGRVHARCGRAPDVVAVRAEGVSLTYGELDEAARRLSGHLARHGVRRGDRVALLTAIGANTVIGLLGILYAGGAWVPLEGTHPVHRLADQAGQAGVAAVVCDHTTRDVAERLGRIEVVDLTRLPVDEPTAAWSDPEVDPKDIAYVIFTSGTTGRPKGVPITHEAMTTYLNWAISTFDYRPGDRMTATASVCFDAAVRQMLAPLLAGATVVTTSRDVLRDPQELLNMVEDERVTVWSSVPTLWVELLRAAERRAARTGTRPDLSALRWVHVGGEPLPPAHVRRWFDLDGSRCPVVNLYGPTEATINATYEVIDARPPDDVDRLPIGRPVAQTIVDVVRPDGSGCPAGEPGELYLAGPALTPGYLGDSGEGIDAFVHRKGRRWYRTGDRVVQGTDGRLELLGRMDDQATIHGHRVEPAEVERVLCCHPSVKDAAVVVDDRGHGPLLAAFVQLDEPTDTNTGPVAVEELRRYLSGRVPEYMLPAQLQVLDALPRTPAGKVDRAGLTSAAEPALWDSSRPRGTAPVTPTERLLAEVWSNLLGVDSVFREDDFFAMGGDSIGVLEVFTRLEEQVPALPSPKAMWSHRTLSDLARVIDATSPTARRWAGDGDSSTVGSFPLTPAQRGFLLAEALAPATRSSWLTCFRMSGPLDEALFQRAVDLLVERHLMLRVAFAAERRPPVQQEVPPPATIPVSFEPAEDEDLPQRIDEERAHRFNPSSWPLVRLRVLQLASEDFRLLVHGHHLIGDGYSVAVLGQELMVLYDALLSGRSAELPRLRSTFRDYALMITDPTCAAPAEPQRSGVSALHTPPRLRREPAAAPEPAPPRAGFSLRRKTTSALRALAASEQTTLYAPALTAFYRALTRLTGQQNLALGVAVTGRDHALPDIGRMVGPFATILPVQVWEPDPAFRVQLRHVASTVALARESGPSMQQLAAATTTSSGLSSFGAQFVFSFLDFDSLGPMARGALRLGWDETGGDMEPPLIGTDVLLTARPVQGELHVTLRAASAALTESELQELADDLRRDLINAASPRAHISRATADADLLDAALIGYLPAPADLGPFTGIAATAELRETIRTALFPDRRPRLLEEVTTPWGRSGFVCLPVFADEIAAHAGSALAAEVAVGVGVAGELGARCVSLAGMIPAYTSYGFDVLRRLPSKDIALTTGHAATAVSVVKTTVAALARARRDLDNTCLALVGLGSIGRSSLELLLARVSGPPQQLILCDLASRLPHLERLATQLATEGYAGDVEICGVESGLTDPVYQADLVIAASSAGRRILDIDRLRPGTILIDDSFPHCFDPSMAHRRMQTRSDIVVVGGGLLECTPSSRRLADGLATLPGAEQLPSRHLRDTIASCQLESLLHTLRPGLPQVRGVVDLVQANAYWDALNREGVRAAPLHLQRHLVTDEYLEAFSRRCEHPLRARDGA